MDLSANEMVSYANAMSERIVELERENERLQSRVELLESKLQETVKNSRSPESIRLKVPSQTKGERG